MKKMTGIIVLFMAIYFVSFSEAATRITVCGTGDNQQILQKLASAFEKKNPNVDIVVPNSIGSTAGINAVAKGECDLGRVARPLKDSEQQLGIKFKAFAFSPVVFVANKKSVSGITNINTDDVLKIFSGKTADWKELGGPKLDITVINRETGDSSRSVIEKAVPGFRDIRNPVGKTIEHNTPKTVQIIANTAGAIGYVPMEAVEKDKMTVLTFNGIAPTPYNVWNGKYKLPTPFAIVWKGELKDAAKSFVDYVTSKEAGKIIVSYGLVPLE